MISPQTPTPQQDSGTRAQSPAGAPPPANKNQDLYDIFVSQGILMISKLKIKVSKDPHTIAVAMASIVGKIESEGEKNGFKFDLDVLLHGSREILEALLRVSGVELSEDELKKVVGLMVGMYFDNAVKTGKMTPQQVAELGQQAKQSQQGIQGGEQQPQSNAPPGAASTQPIESKGVQPSQRQAGLLGGAVNG